MAKTLEKQIRHIIWDWNGTLLDDRWLCIESINRLLLDRGISPIDDRKYLEIFGFPVRDYYLRAGFDFTVEPYEVPAMQFIELYDSRRLECKLQPGALEVLRAISSMGIGQSLLSASETGVLEQMACHHGIQSFFGQIRGLDNHYAHGKLDLGHELVRSLPWPRESILMIGDTCHDSEVAESLGVSCILYTGGHFPESRLRGCGRILVDSLSGLMPLLPGLEPLH